MTQTIVSLDIETTGLDANKDSIIEIGAVKFRGDRIEDEYTTLINPGCRIPDSITQLTGITDAMVADAPTLISELAHVVQFISDAPVVGHNIRFDLGFFRQHQALTLNPVLDTFDLASVLLFSAGRYSLGSLTAELGIALPASHRALDDARATWAVYRALFARALELPLDTLKEIVRLGKHVDWGGDQAFQEALQMRSNDIGVRSSPSTFEYSTSLFADAASERESYHSPQGRPLQPCSSPTALDLKQLESLFTPGGRAPKPL